MKPMFTMFCTLTASLCTALVLGCPQGTKTTVEAGVSAVVDPAHCKEASTSGAANPLAVQLDCATLTGSGNVRIEFPRKAWLATKWDVADAGPGK